MSGNHSAHSAHSSQRTSSGSTGKVALLIVLLVVVVLALGILLAQLLGFDIFGGLGGGNATANVAPGIFTQVEAEYSSGKNVAGNLTITQGTQRPEEIPETADVVLLDISWTGKKEMSEPLYITVSDPSFTDGDGLAIYHFNHAGQWDKVGEYEISNNSVTFLATELSPFAFQVLSSEPEPLATEEPTVTAEPTATPEPTPEPTPATIPVADYGTYTGVRTGAYTLASEMEDDQVYVVALVKDLPADAIAAPSDTADGEQTEGSTDGSSEETSDGGLTISYVDAPEATTAAETAPDPAAAATPVPNTASATVLLNLDGQNLSLVDMPLIQDDAGTWFLGGPVTEGMLWTSNRDAYKDEHRFSLKNNDRYLNLDDNDQNVVLDDNGTRTRWLVEPATLGNGTTASILNYRNDSRYYVNQMSMVSETLAGAAPVATPTQAPDGTTPAAEVTGPVYVGMAAPADTSVILQKLGFTVTTEQSQTMQLVLFKLNEGMTAPEGTVNVLQHNIIIPEITEGTNLSTLAIRDGDIFLQLGVDYILNARVVDDHVVVVIQFMGSYSGQIVRTYSGTTIVTNDMPAPSATPESSPSATPTATPGGGGEGSNVSPPAPVNPSGTTTTPKPSGPTNTDIVVEENPGGGSSSGGSGASPTNAG